jgi:hypothetical protein
MTGLKDAMRRARLLALVAAAMAPGVAAHAEDTVFAGALFGDTRTEYLGHRTGGYGGITLRTGF